MNNWALIGLGFISERHRKAIASIGDKVLVTCDIDSSKFADFIYWRSLLDSVAWKHITHVAVCTPNHLHVSICAAMKDKIVLCEKPLGLSSEKVKKLPDTVFTVLQLRHHPKIMRLKEAKLEPKKVELYVNVKRDAEYWKGWKGDKKKSGGILFNLGIHYFDLLLYLFGDDYSIESCVYTEREAHGNIRIGKTQCSFTLQIQDHANGQDRKLTIDGQELSLSKQDNLSFEDLHTKVYQDLIRGVGVRPREAAKSIEFVEHLKRYGV